MSVLQEIEQHRPELQELCQRIGVHGLRVRIDSNQWRDVTFIGDIDVARIDGYAGRFFDLEEGLLRIFHRRVHLLDEEGVEAAARRNPLRKRVKEAEVELLHAS